MIAANPPAHVACEEDQPCFDWRTMGNGCRGMGRSRVCVMLPSAVAERLASALGRVQVYELARVSCTPSTKRSRYTFTCEAISVPFRVGDHVQDARTFVHVTATAARVVTWSIFGAVA